MKYNSKKTRCANGHLHDSKKEAKRCNALHGLENAGVISGLKIQQKFELIPAQRYENMENERSCSYVADFTYYLNGIFTIEDTKGFKTPEYIIKRKLLKQRYCTNEKTIFIET